MTTQDPPVKNLGATKIQDWVAHRRAAGTDAEPFLYVNPRDNVLIGMAVITAYLGIRSPVTFYQWIELYGLPAIKRPDGQWMTTMTSIDQWIFMACEVDNENRPHSRGGPRLDIARRRLDARLNEQALREARTQPHYKGRGPRPGWTDRRYACDNQTEIERQGDQGEQGKGE